MTLVGAMVLPALFVQVPPVVISMSPPMVVLLPWRVTAEAVEMLLPALVAVLPVIEIDGLFPSSNRLAPPT